MVLECGARDFAVSDVALVIAVEEQRLELSQVTLLDWLTAQRTARLRARCSAVHEDEFHVPPPNEKALSPMSLIEASAAQSSGAIMHR